VREHKAELVDAVGAPAAEPMALAGE
jgi:hypothetical protein